MNFQKLKNNAPEIAFSTQIYFQINSDWYHFSFMNVAHGMFELISKVVTVSQCSKHVPLSFMFLVCARGVYCYLFDIDNWS